MGDLPIGKNTGFFGWPNSRGPPAQVKKFSKVKNFQKHFKFWPF
jgi:hypothetical protein